MHKCLNVFSGKVHFYIEEDFHMKVSEASDWSPQSETDLLFMNTWITTFFLQTSSIFINKLASVR